MILSPVNRFTFEERKVDRRPASFHTAKICLAESGSAVCSIDGKDYDVHPGLIFILPNSKRRYFKSIRGKITMVILEADPGEMTAMQRELFVNCPVDLPLNVHAGEIPDFCNFLYQALKESQSKAPFSKQYTDAYVQLALHSVLRFFADVLPKKASKTRPETAYVLRCIEKRITEDISLSQIAALVHLSPSALSKQFRRHTGVGFSQYVTSKRVRKAIEMLQNTENNVLDIAYACGFHNSAAFYDAFKKITGTVPLAYRTGIVV